MWETDPHLGISPQMKLPVPEMGYIYLSCWLKRPNGNPQTIQTIDKTIDCFPQTYGKALWLKTAPTQFTEHKEVELMSL